MDETTRVAIRAALKGHDPSEEQRIAIEAPPPLGVIAGAGSGKTAVMAARMAYFIATGAAHPTEILGLTFTNKAAQELKERVRAAVEPLRLGPGEEPSVFTYHSFADRLIRDFGPAIGVEPEVGLMSEAQAHMLLARLLEELTFDVVRVRAVNFLIGRIRSLADACANHLLEPERLVAADERLRAELEARGSKLQRDLVSSMAERPDLCRAVRAYIDRKAELGRIDYGDQIAIAYEIVRRRPEVALALNRRWPFVLLDEYQDTNVAQRKMMQQIYPPGSRITVVGDPDQAIYAWRGATLYNILNFKDHFPDEEGRVAALKPLETSFRSGRRILEVADEVIGKVDGSRRAGDKVLRHHQPTGEGEVTCDLVATDEIEARMIAAEIKALTQDSDLRADGESPHVGPGTRSSGERPDGAPVPYDEIAILCRKKRLFPRLLAALRDENIPVEVVGLSGLLTVPEVVDLLAYLRLITDPSDNISFARIAMGPRWRVHFRDLAALARWAAIHTRLFQKALEERDARPGEIDPGEERFSLSEALPRIGEVEELSDEARGRFVELHEELERMRREIEGRSVAEAVERILHMSGIEDELIAADSDRARGGLANLGSLLDHAASFSPLEGSATLEAYLDYLETASTVEDIEVAQPQMDDSVKLMTVHQAKGLEFDVVYIPGLAKGIFPDVKVTDDPTKGASTIPFWARDDRDALPEFDGVLSRFRDELRERAEEEERRLAYVAFTRARSSLHLSAAHWYSSTDNRERKTPNGPGLFFTELVGASPGTEPADGEEGRAAEEGGAAHPAVVVRRLEACPEDNPIRAEWVERAREWPPADEEGADDLFSAGWRRAVERAREDERAIDELVASAGVDPTDFEAARAGIARSLEQVTAPPPPAKPNDRLKSLSVSSMVQLARCPKQFYWTVVRPLPRRPSAQARLGQEIHRWIEIRSLGQQRLDDPEVMPDVAPEEVGDSSRTEPAHTSDPAGSDGSARNEKAGRSNETNGSAATDGSARPDGSAATDGSARPDEEALKRTYESSLYARAQPRYVEQPFAIFLAGEFLVRGRIDAVYVHDDGTWELVDFKTGAEADASDPTTAIQLAIYALAARRIWKVDPSKLKVTYFYLSTGRTHTTSAVDLPVEEADLLEEFKAVESQSFDPTPGKLCHWCDFLRFCDAGQDFVSASRA